MSKLEDLHALTLSVARLGRGLVAFQPAPREPAALLELFDFEGCPYCRKVRETLSELDLDYLARSSARGASSRVAGIALGGKRQFPILHDANSFAKSAPSEARGSERGWGPAEKAQPLERLPATSSGAVLYESEAIIDYLHTTYGAGRSRWQTLLAPLDTAGSTLTSALRRRGKRVRDGLAGRPQPAQLLELWSFEASPYCRKVREELAELGLDYIVHNVAKRGRRRPVLVALGGKMQVPYLSDPNTGTALYESDDIVAYLRTAYGTP